MLMLRQGYKGLLLSVKLHPYVVFLPAEEKDKILSAIFGSKAGVDVLRFSLKQGVSKNIYQRDLFKKLNYSNKTIIEHLKSLTKLGILNEDMEKNEREGRIIWIKAYQLTDAGKWFALLLAEEKELSEKEKAEILQSLFRTYVKLVKGLAEELGINKKMLEEIFNDGLCSFLSISPSVFTVDTPGKDTWRYAQKGAKTIIIISPNEIATIEKGNTENVSLQTLLKKCRENDVVLIEGLKKQVARKPSMPKIPAV